MSSKRLETLGLADISLNQYFRESVLHLPESLVGLDISSNDHDETLITMIGWYNCKKLKFVRVDGNPERNVDKAYQYVSHWCPRLLFGRN